MKNKIALFLIICLVCLCFISCANKGDYVDIHNKKSTVFDNINIELPNGYFYDSHEKFRVDENTVGVTIYFSNEKDDGWD